MTTLLFPAADFTFLAVPIAAEVAPPTASTLSQESMVTSQALQKVLPMAAALEPPYAFTVSQPVIETVPLSVLEAVSLPPPMPAPPSAPLSFAVSTPYCPPIAVRVPTSEMLMAPLSV